jgi:hypothetical protein
VPVARAFAFLLLVLTCTGVAALGGYTLGARSNPSEAAAATERVAAVRVAVDRAVAEQAARDRRLRRRALADAMAWQREKYLAMMRRRLDEQRLADAEQATRAYARGRAAGRAAAERRAELEAERAEDDDGEEDAEPTAAAR